MNLKIATKSNCSSNGYVKNELNNLTGLDEQGVEEKIFALVSNYGAVQAVSKLGEEIFQNNTLSLYLIRFYHDVDAQNAIFALDGTAFGRTSMVLRLH